MKSVMPQELEVWYLIPALRREFAKVFVEEYGMKQKQAAHCLGITEAAISQYLKAKRGNEVKFSEKSLADIKKAAKEILENKDNVMEKLYELCVSLRKSKAMCGFHRMKDKKVPKNCELCMKN